MARLFFMTRGVAGCGKSTFIKENGLDPLTVSSDKIRLLMSSPIQDSTGHMNIDQRKMKQAWGMVNDLLEMRFQSGATTILDATNLKEKDTRPLRNLAQKYRYRVYMIDFTDIPDEEIYRRNAGRDPMARVPDHVIARMLNVAKSSQVPSGVTVVTREEALSIIDKPYETAITDDTAAVNVIGDVHGCATALSDLMKRIGDSANKISITAPVGIYPDFEDKSIEFFMPRTNEKYIFVGDYLDRGIENAHIVEYLSIIIERGFDVTLLEGNHERWLRMWGEGGGEYKNHGFVAFTKTQLEKANVSPKKARKISSKLAQYTCLAMPNGRRFMITHGGLSSMPGRFGFVSTNEMIHGSGAYEEIEIAERSWNAQQKTGDGIIQIHGHRNADGKLFCSEYSIDLEDGVEYGGHLRAVRIMPNSDFELIEIENKVFFIPPEETKLEDDDMASTIAALKTNRYIGEKELGDNISSFNFTRKAFGEKAWNSQTVRARGLFIDTSRNCVKARSYDKFFAIGEREETHLETLARTFEYPVQAYVKENGYLGICSYDDNGTLFCASKSTIDSIYAKRFREILEATLGDKASDFSKFLEDGNLSAVFEVIDPENDRHMVDYGYPCVVLLALVENKMEFLEKTYDELVQVAGKFGLFVKRHAIEIEDPQQLMDWYSLAKDYDYKFKADSYDGFGNLDGNADDGYSVEGFVLTDSRGQMVKVKGDWYQFWKFFRSVTRDVFKRGKSARLNGDAYIKSFASTPDPNEVYAFIKNLLNNDRDAKSDEPPEIIDVRRAWESRP